MRGTLGLGLPSQERTLSPSCRGQAATLLNLVRICQEKEAGVCLCSISPPPPWPGTFQLFFMLRQNMACPSRDFSPCLQGPERDGETGKGMGQEQGPWGHVLAVSHQLREVDELHHLPGPWFFLWRMLIKAPPLGGRTTVKWLCSPEQAKQRVHPHTSHLHEPQSPDPSRPLRTRA